MIKEMLNELLGVGNPLFDPALGGPLQGQLFEGAPDSPVCILAGSNASGKSLAVRVLASWLNAEEPAVEPLQVSMRFRTSAGMHRAFMFGLGDSEDSTGNVSLAAVEGGLCTAQSRERGCVLFLDEPDIGLSEDYAHAMGSLLARHVAAGLGAHCHGLVLVTHSRELVDGLVSSLPAEPHFIHLDPEPMGLRDWLASRRRRTVEELLDLPKLAHRNYVAVSKVLDRRKENE